MNFQHDSGDALTAAASSMPIDVGATCLELCANRAAFWPAARVLAVADVHLGKAAAYRARGVPVPETTTAAIVARLTALLVRWQPRTLVFLGDLFHGDEAYGGGVAAAIAAWRTQHADVEMILVEGNHDAKAGAAPAALGLRRVAEPFVVGPLAFCHVPQHVPGCYALAGHLHPCVRLYGRAGDALRLPCFWLRDRIGVLPAFGEFTGGWRIEREANDRVVAVGAQRLFEIPAVRG